MTKQAILHRLRAIVDKYLTWDSECLYEAQYHRIKKIRLKFAETLYRGNPIPLTKQELSFVKAHPLSLREVL